MVQYHIRFSDRAQFEDLPKIDVFVREGIAAAIEGKLTTAPDIFGKPLRHTMHLFKVLRVGDWRVVFIIEKTTVHILTIRHRKKGYDDLA